MLVFADIEQLEQPDSLRLRIAERLIAVGRAAADRQRHEMLVSAFIDTGMLLQGLADQAFQARHIDDVSVTQQNGAILLAELADAVKRSWESGFECEMHPPTRWFDQLMLLNGNGPLRFKRCEGYSYYALYPEAYLEAAKRSGLSSHTVVIGLRSIGLSLAAIVAAGLGAEPAFSLRPIGAPFSRRVAVSENLSRMLLADRACDFAIVDEGPGLSGSSFNSAADWLESKGVPPQRINFFPSHLGEPGPHASEHHRRRWSRRRRHFVGMDALLIDPPQLQHRLQGWVCSQLGIAEQSWQDISGGAWRDLNHTNGEPPPSYRQMEKRKFLLGGEGQRWLVKFAGLGAIGQDKIRKGEVLAAAGFTPRPVGICHGFLVEKWMDGVRADLARLNGSQVIEPIGRYLSFRARHLPATNGGASLETLYRMTLVNIGEFLGTSIAESVRKRMVDPERIDEKMFRVDTDNRLHMWEWLITPDGRMLKTDALDHSGAHDLVGCQDIGWDVAGACVEFGLTPLERLKLAKIVEREARHELTEDLLTSLEACYLGFQIGLWENGRSTSSGFERERISALLQRYVQRIHDLIGMKT